MPGIHDFIYIYFNLFNPTYIREILSDLFYYRFKACVFLLIGLLSVFLVLESPPESFQCLYNNQEINTAEYFFMGNAVYKMSSDRR